MGVSRRLVSKSILPVDQEGLAGLHDRSLPVSLPGEGFP
jgi:hypothetical protein